MHLIELAEVTGAKINVRYIHEQRRFHADLEGAEVIEPGHEGVLASLYGTGTTPEMAQRDYAKQIRGKRLVFCLSSGPRREYQVPKSLSF